MNPSRSLNVFDCPLDGINLIEASAGTGKTWTICGLYLRLLLERALTVRQILVVTFTKAATAELRERIRARIVGLREFLTREPATDVDHFIVTLAGMIDRSGRGRQACIDLLQRAAESFDEASIFTIHGFCQRALADNPFSAGLPMAMELVEDDHELLMEAVNDFWRRHVAADSVPPEFALYLNERGDSPETYAKLLERHLAKPLARHLWPDDIDAPVIDAGALNDLYRQIRDIWLHEKSAIVGLLLGSLSSLHGQTYKEPAVRAGAGEWDGIFRDHPFAKLGNKAQLYRASVLEAKKKKHGVPPKHAFFEQAERYCSLRERLDASFSLARMRLLRRLFDEAGSQLRTLKRSRQVISFNDMLSNVHERLTNPAYPWLAASIKQRFPAALIDEFQDTDPLQFDIFRKVYDADARVFVVGDPKQAIYSFRHADLHTYLRAKSWATNAWSLADNQRSSEPLLVALNGLFEANENAFVLPGLEYQHVSFGDKPRSVFVDDTVPRAPLQVWSLPAGAGGALSKGSARLAAVGATSAEIARLIQAGSRGRITLDGEPLCPRHIAVLVRTRALGSEMKRSLAGLGVGAVEIAPISIFHATEARDLEIALTAILSPSREPLVRAALATDLFGCTVSDIEAMSGSETRLMERLSQFTEYRDVWLHRGFGVMYRRLLADQAVARRMLSRADGERRLTNFMHLGEILHQAAETHGAPEALLRHLKSERDGESRSDAAQLRLESDQNLVQILTIHTCKGLEFPVVFCPFVCDGATKFGGSSIEGREYHDDDLLPVIDFRQYDDSAAAFLDIGKRMRSEQAAETVRLLYVALTRAIHRCYLVVGTYGRRSIKESSCSMLNWLAAGRGMPLDAWFAAPPTAEAIDSAWRRFAQLHAGSVDLSALPPGGGTPLIKDAAEPILTSPPASIVVAGGWRLSSYSGLTFGAKSELAANDHDARAVEPSSLPRLPTGLAEDDILRFPRGAGAGDCIHAVFEEIDFADVSTWDGAIATALARHPQTPGPAETGQQESLAAMLRNLVNDVTGTTLIPGLELRTVPWSRRLTELEFTFPVQHLVSSELNAALKGLGYDMPVLRSGRLEGYLKGFVDLIFEHEGRFFILDWKSNHLGYEPADYAATPLAGAMAEHGYHLQHLLYAVALDRFLQLRIRDYSYETHFGGVLYLFVRGVRPTWTGSDAGRPGVYFHRPTLDTIQRLSVLLDAPARAAAG